MTRAQNAMFGWVVTRFENIWEQRVYNGCCCGTPSTSTATTPRHCTRSWATTFGPCSPSMAESFRRRCEARRVVMAALAEMMCVAWRGYVCRGACACARQPLSTPKAPALRRYWAVGAGALVACEVRAQACRGMRSRASGRCDMERWQQVKAWSNARELVACGAASSEQQAANSKQRTDRYRTDGGQVEGWWCGLLLREAGWKVV